MDFLSLQAAGAGGFGLDQPFMCNGANLCYSKQAFQEVEALKEMIIFPAEMMFSSYKNLQLPT
jgi:hypothetical protein